MQSTETFCRYLLDMLVLGEDFGSLEFLVNGQRTVLLLAIVFKGGRLQINQKE